MTTTPQPLIRVRRRPPGLYMVCLLLTISVVYNALDAYSVFNGRPSLQYPSLVDTNFRYGIDAFRIILSALCIAGLLSGQRWAWHLTMLLMGFQLFIGVWAYFLGRPPYLSLLVNALSVLYLNLRSVQDFFKTPEPGLVETPK